MPELIDASLFETELRKASAESGWNEDSERIVLCRFLATLCDRHPVLLHDFQEFLREQVADEALLSGEVAEDDEDDFDDLDDLEEDEDDEDDMDDFDDDDDELDDDDEDELELDDDEDDEDDFDDEDFDNDIEDDEDDED